MTPMIHEQVSTGSAAPVEEYLQRDYLVNITSREGAKSLPRMLAKIAMTAAFAPMSARKARRLAAAGEPLKLHLGCGTVYVDGWVNIDLARPGRRQDLDWDLCRGLPFPDRTVEAIFSEHFFEHINLADALALLRECRRTLIPGGVLRISVPDLERSVRSYLGLDPTLDRVRPGRPTRGLALGELFFFHGHRAMYDFETLALLLREVGFVSVERSAFHEGRLQPNPDSEARRLESLYVEAVA